MSNTPQTEAQRLADAIDGAWLENVDPEQVDVPTIQAELRRLDADNQRLEKKCASYRNLVHSLEQQRSELQKGHVAALEAAQTLESERDANAILTAENDQLRAQLDAQQNIYYQNDQLREQLALAVAKEREECAKVCDEAVAEFGGIAEGKFVTDFGKHTHQSMAAGAMNCAAAIRARGEA